MMFCKKKYIVIATVFFLFSILVIHRAYLKLTYIEYESFNENDAENIVTIDDVGLEIEQEFVMPYEILSGVGVKATTFDRDNNSRWLFSMVDLSSGKVLYKDEFNGSVLNNNDYYNIEFNKRIRVYPKRTYCFSISAIDVNSTTGIGFYSGDSGEAEGNILHINGNSTDESLSFKIYGGNRDYWWIRFSVICLVCLLYLICRCYYVEIKGKLIKNDLIILSIVVGAISFALLFSFANQPSFIDETDNMIGGMVIANGGVLYRDYVVQHTPVVYYICSVFASLGARSEPQFRLSYYFIEAVVWGLLYFRHASFYGKKKMLLLPVAEIIFISSGVARFGTTILSDGVQGLCYVVLIMEFLRYYKDKTLDWDRSIIFSCSIWGSFGSAFISAYSLIWVLLIAIIIEIKYWKDNGFIMQSAVNRYYKLLTSIILPFVAAVLYFKINHSLKRAFEQFYLFNREVYVNYGYLENNVIAPFVDGISNFFDIIVENFLCLFLGSVTVAAIQRMTIIVLVITILSKLLREKEYIKSSLFFLVYLFSATRGYEDIHGLAAWYVAILIITLNLELLNCYFIRIKSPILIVALIVLCSSYVNDVAENWRYRQSPITKMEKEVIRLTQDEADYGIFLDAWPSSSLYYFYKGRYPVNSAVYMLPWFMDWYEQENVIALRNNHPKIVIYNLESEISGHMYFSNSFVNELEKEYSLVSEEPWSYKLWVRDE